METTKKLGFGLMRLPVLDGDGAPDIAVVSKMVDRFMAGGFTYFDTAYVYHSGMSEVAFRKAVVERYPRDSFTIADKMPVFQVKETADYERIFAEQLERCGVSYFDFYLLHALDAEKYEETCRFGGFDFMRQVKARGATRRIGFSFHDSADVLDRILTEHPEMEFVQLQINYVDWESENVQSRRCYEVARKHGKPIIVMEPVKGGFLANLMPDVAAQLEARAPGASAASWAVRYAASLEGVLVVLSGMSTYEQMEDNASYMERFVPLDDDERALIAQVAERIAASAVIPCTACKYCVDGCPMKIAIPRLFSLYNRSRQFDVPKRFSAEFARVTRDTGKPSQCVECGQCEDVCPQHIGIIEWLKEVANTFERQ
ncbi:MAG: aldo/keto reductase [Clostridia bacterium]|nr:aldo/keto reductase [Clostridia bacterium]